MYSIVSPDSAPWLPQAGANDSIPFSPPPGEGILTGEARRRDLLYVQEPGIPLACGLSKSKDQLDLGSDQPNMQRDAE